MNRKEYVCPLTEIVRVRVSEPVLVLTDLFTGSNKEDSHESWFGAKETGGDEGGLWGDDNGSLWDDDLDEE